MIGSDTKIFGDLGWGGGGKGAGNGDNYNC